MATPRKDPTPPIIRTIILFMAESKYPFLLFLLSSCPLHKTYKKL